MNEKHIDNVPKNTTATNQQPSTSNEQQRKESKA